MRRRPPWGVLHQQVRVIAFPVDLPQLRADVTAGLPHRVLAALEHVGVGRAVPVLRYKDRKDVERGNHVPAAAVMLP